MDRRVWFSLGLVLALTGILAAYYLVHKPVTPAQAGALASTLANAGVAALLTLLGGGIGRWLLGRWGEQSHDLMPGEAIALQAALGLGVIGLVMLGLGMVGLYYSALTRIITLLALLLLWRDVRGWWAEAGRALRAIVLPDRLARFAAAFVLLSLALGLLRALAPPLMWDALVYHLTLPKLYAQTHRLWLAADTENIFTGMPQLTEMLYTAAVLLRGEIAAQVMGWASGLVLALGLAAHTSALVPKGQERYSLFAPAILFASLSLALALSWAYAEMLLMLNALAVLIALRQWRCTRKSRWLWLSGALAGLAVSCKYTGVLVPIAGAAVVLVEGINQKGEGKSIASPPFSLLPASLFACAFFLLAALLTFSPWLIKNWLFTGNPTYPLALATGQSEALRQWFYNRPDLADHNPLVAAFILPRAVLRGVQGGNDYDATLTPLLVFLPLALALGWRGLAEQVRHALRPSILFMLVSYAGWVLLALFSSLALQVRLFFAIFPALVLLCAAGLEAVQQLDSPTLRISVVVNTMVVFVLGISLLENSLVVVAQNPLAYLTGLQSAADYRKANLGWYATAIERVNALPEGAYVEFLWEARSLECAASDRCAPDVIIDRWWLLRRTVGTAGAILARWKQAGITHVLIYDLGANFVRADPTNAFTDSDWAELDALRGQMQLVENLGGVYSLYALP